MAFYNKVTSTHSNKPKPYFNVNRHHLHNKPKLSASTFILQDQYTVDVEFMNPL